MPTTGSRRRNNLRLFNLCFSSFMHPFAPESPPTTTTNSSLLHDQHEIDHNRPSPSTTTATSSSSSMIKNYNTLYDHRTRTSSPYPFEHEPDSEPEPADFVTAFASNRFFFSSPGRSNSIVESTNTDTDCTQPSTSSSSLSSITAVPAPEDDSDGQKKKVVLNGSVAVPTYSPDPYADFRRSMQEMVEARPELVMDVKSNWEALHELLLSYLALNPKSTHKFILGAFSDLLVTIMSLSSYPPQQNPNLDDGGGGGC